MLDVRLKLNDKRRQGKRGGEHGKCAKASYENAQAEAGLFIRAVITLFCGVGLYVSLFMLRKTRRAERGELREPSVVQSPRARLFGGTPNAVFGTLYYPALALAVWFATASWQLGLLLTISAFAAVVSLALAYSLLFVTRMPCPYCWTAHAINLMLALCNTLLFLKISYWR